MDTKVPSTAITSINGMRVLSMWWVILGHTYSVQTMAIPLSKYPLVNACKSHLTTRADLCIDRVCLNYLTNTKESKIHEHYGLISHYNFSSVGNLLLAYDIIHRFTFQTVGNATFSVDSFFFLRWVFHGFSLCIKEYFQSVQSHSVDANRCYLLQTT